MALLGFYRDSALLWEPIYSGSMLDSLLSLQQPYWRHVPYNRTKGSVMSSFCNCPHVWGYRGRSPLPPISRQSCPLFDSCRSRVILGATTKPKMLYQPGTCGVVLNGTILYGWKLYSRGCDHILAKGIATATGAWVDPTMQQLYPGAAKAGTTWSRRVARRIGTRSQVRDTPPPSVDRWNFSP